MKASCILIGVAVAGIGAGAFFWNRTRALESELAALRDGTAQSDQQSARSSEQIAAEAAQAKAQAAFQTKELVKLRGEVSQLRASGSQELQQLRTENASLKRALQQGSAAPANTGNPPAASADQFPKDSWTFAGYKTPENALVSAIWAMREGDPKTYLNSLAGEERKRVEQEWAGKSEADLAAKHQSDVAKITGMQILERQNLSDSEMTMKVFVSGPDRPQNVHLLKVDDEWKFAGFVPEPTAPPAQ